MQTLHKYQILEKIGTGGFGTVYKASDPFIKRHVAIKTCTSADPETRDRFLREAEIAGNLHHRNIVTVYDFGFEEGTPFLVQEYLSGEDLDRKIKRRDFVPLPEKVYYLVQIARGLEYAHDKGVVHRDIKPANIRILEDDTAKIMDFGIAKLAQEQATLTQDGITLGTAAYLAPEQIRGERSDARTDIFAFGALAYELISSERPFAGAEISAIFYRILNEEAAPLTRAAPDCPPELERIVMRCLEKDPAKRYAGCRGLVHDLEELGRRRAAGDRGGARPANLSTGPHGTATTILPRRGTEEAGTPDPAAALEAARTARRAPTLGDLELDLAGAAGHVHSDGLDTLALRSRTRGGATALKAAVALLVLAAAGWGAWRLQDEWRSSAIDVESAALAAPMAGMSQAHAASAPVDAPAPSEAAPATEPPVPDGETAPAEPAPAEPAPAEPAPAPPPPPQPAVLIVAPGWDAAMTVKVGKKSWPLDRERRFELEAGSYTLRYAIATPAYSHSGEQRVRLAAGETQRVTPPLGRPGRLTVQPHLNTPQGFVRLDGQPAGPTPLRGRWLAPGVHLVEIAASGESGAAAVLSETVEVTSDQETILSFDLGGAQPRNLSSRPALPN